MLFPIMYKIIGTFKGSVLKQQLIVFSKLKALFRISHTTSISTHVCFLQIQLTVSEDGIVTVVEPGSSKMVEKEDLHETIKLPVDHTLTVHQLQQIVGQQVCCRMFSYSFLFFIFILLGKLTSTWPTSSQIWA